MNQGAWSRERFLIADPAQDRAAHYIEGFIPWVCVGARTGFGWTGLKEYLVALCLGLLGEHSDLEPRNRKRFGPVFLG
jgi:hypothetical protein